MNAATSFTATIRSIFDRPDSTTCALVASLASALRAQPDLSTWVASLAVLPRSERSASLLNASRNFRGEWATLGAADALKRIAMKPALFNAVARELQTA